MDAIDALYKKHYAALYDIIVKRVPLGSGTHHYGYAIIEQLTKKGDFLELEERLRGWTFFTTEDIEQILTVMKAWHKESGGQLI